MSPSALGAGLSGLQTYQRGLDASASKIANPSAVASGGGDLENGIVGSIVNKAGFQASAQVVKTADSLLGSLIDTKA